MSTDAETLRVAFSRDIRDYRSVSCSGNGTVGGTTVVASTLSGYENDFFKDWWIRITSGTYDGTHQQVNTFVGSTGTFTMMTAFGGQILSGVTFELHKYDPDDLLRAVNAGAGLLWPDIFRVRLDDTLVVDNDLVNPSFDTWATTPTGWTAVGAPTEVEETSLVWHGSSLKLTGPAGAVGQEYQDLTRNVRDVAGKTCHFKMMAWSNAASEARIGLDFGSGHASNKWSDYHGGDSGWELLEVEQAVPASATRIRRIVEVAATKVAYFDAGYSYIDPLLRLTLPSTIKEGPYAVKYAPTQDDRFPRYVEWQSWQDEDDGTSKYIRFTAKPPTGCRLQVTGLGYLTALTTDASTIEIDGPRVSLLIAQAAACLFTTLASPGAGPVERAAYERAAVLWQNRANSLRQMPQMRMDRPTPQLHGAWTNG